MKSILNHLEYLKQFDYKTFFRKKTYQYFEPIIKIYNMFFVNKRKKLFDEPQIIISSDLSKKSQIEDTMNILIIRQVVSKDIVSILREERSPKRNIKTTTVEESIEYSSPLSIVPMILKTQHQVQVAVV